MSMIKVVSSHDCGGEKRRDGINGEITGSIVIFSGEKQVCMCACSHLAGNAAYVVE